MSASDILACGIDLGGTQIKTVQVAAGGHIAQRRLLPTDDSATAPCWKETIRGVVAPHASHVGLAAPGLADAAGRKITALPGRLLGLEGLDWTEFLERPAVVLNDAHAALLGETWRGAARGRQHVVMLTLGTGVGGAVLCEGRLWRGAIGRAGHCGHMSLNPRGVPDIVGTPGSLETAIGECTVRARTGFASTQALVAAARAGSDPARRAWEESVEALAAGIVSLINVFDPEMVVLGGGITAAGDMLFAPLEQFLARMEWRPAGRRVPVVRAELGGWAGAVGAAWQALYGQDHRISGSLCGAG